MNEFCEPDRCSRRHMYCLDNVLKVSRYPEPDFRRLLPLEICSLLEPKDGTHLLLMLVGCPLVNEWCEVVPFRDILGIIVDACIGGL